MSDLPNLPPGAADSIASPALLVWPDRVSYNVDRMIDQVGGDVERLRPHVKTHKMAEVVILQLQAGISKFKCATIAEAEMLAVAGALDILLAYQPVGPNISRLLTLVDRFPQTSFAALVDDAGALENLSRQIPEGSPALRLYVDVDCGMGRTGIAPNSAAELCHSVATTPGVRFAGLHVYDGHLHDPEIEARRSGFERAIDPILRLAEDVQPDAIVGGGSPTFGLHAGGATWECSPGTTLFWDAGYGDKFPDLSYEVAAALLTRVISKPGENRLCLDLGHKAVAAENPLANRVRFPALPGDLQFISQSEEHLVVESKAAGEWEIGDALIGIPVHICPSVALHMEAVLIGDDGSPTGECWKTVARDRRISV
ncbi:MAG: D-TA family PLP-dependent enzyme [Verrucomicrobiales bacterium]